jgi:hypothetical protein
VSRNVSEPSTSYGQQKFGAPASNPEQDHAFFSPQSDAPFFQQAHYTPPRHAGYTTAYNPSYYTNTPGMTVSNKNDNALIVELICSLLGLFGVGWLMAGETTIGIILLIGSVLIYWPLMIGGTILTIGIGLLCLGPIAIGVIILNTLLLNSLLNRKAAKFVVTQQQPGIHRENIEQ